MRYGLPYQGSKNPIAEQIVKALPSGEVFADIFFGGGAVTHAAICSGKWERFIINDIDPMPMELFYGAVRGAYRDRTEWIGRKEFFEKKERDPFVKYCWSFGNAGRAYMYAPHWESYKHAVHDLLMDGDVVPLSRDESTILRFTEEELIPIVSANNSQERYLRFKRLVKSKLKAAGGKQSENYARLQNLERLQSLEHLQELERAKGFGNLERHCGDYADVPLPKGAVVYCDVPYEGTEIKFYSGEVFDSGRFWRWAAEIGNCFVSEYRAPIGWNVLCEIRRVSHFNRNNAESDVMEKVFTTENVDSQMTMDI